MVAVASQESCLENSLAARAATNLVRREPSSDAANGRTNPEPVDRPNGSARDPDLATIVTARNTESGSCGASGDKTLATVVVERVLALWADDLGHTVNVRLPSNENKMSYRERERALLRIDGLKSCKAGYNGGSRLAPSPG